jgi:hypothetical protein
LMPKKKPRWRSLTDEERAMNHLISEARIPIEHAIWGMKRFWCAAQINRSKNGLDDTFTFLSAGLWNFHLQMKW